MISRRFLCVAFVLSLSAGHLLADSHGGCNCHLSHQPEPFKDQIPVITAWRHGDECKDIYVRIEGDMPECTLVALLKVKHKPGHYDLRFKAGKGDVTWQAFERKVDEGFVTCSEDCKCNTIKIRVADEGFSKYIPILVDDRSGAVEMVEAHPTPEPAENSGPSVQGPAGESEGGTPREAPPIIEAEGEDAYEAEDAET